MIMIIMDKRLKRVQRDTKTFSWFLTGITHRKKCSLKHYWALNVNTSPNGNLKLVLPLFWGISLFQQTKLPLVYIQTFLETKIWLKVYFGRMKPTSLSSPHADETNLLCFSTKNAPQTANLAQEIARRSNEKNMNDSQMHLAKNNSYNTIQKISGKCPLNWTIQKHREFLNTKSNKILSNPLDQSFNFLVSHLNMLFTTTTSSSTVTYSPTSCEQD